MTPPAVRRRCAYMCVAVGVAVPGPMRGIDTSQGMLEQVVVTINGDVVTKTEIDERLRVVRGSAASPEDPVEPDLLTRVLRDAVDERLMIQRAAELGLIVRDEDVDRLLASVKAESGVTTDDAFIALLATEGMSLPTLRATTRRQLIIEQVREHLFARVTVSNDEAMRYFNAHRAEMGLASVTFREIRIAVPHQGGIPDIEHDRALVRVVAAGDRLAAGTDFEEVVREFSESPSKASGGLVGPVDPATLEPAVRSALEALHPGGMTRPVEVSTGYCFVKLERSQPKSAPTFHENRDQVVDALLTAKQRAALNQLLDQLRAAAMLQWKRRDLQDAYQRPSAYR